MLQTSTELFPVVLTYDPAIDTERMPREVMDEYVKTRKLSLVEPYFKPGEVPTKFWLRRIKNNTFLSYVDDAPHEGTKLLRAFQVGVVKIENVRTPDGPVIPTVLPTSPQNESGEPAWLTQKELDFFFPGDIGEIGTVAYQRSFLAPWIARPFGVPHSSLGILSQKTYRPAERKVAAASSSEPSTSPVSGDQGSETSGAI